MLALASVWKPRLKPATAGETSESIPRDSASTACTVNTYRCGGSPCGGAAPYVTRHGFGYSVFEHTERGIESELTVYVDLEAPVKFSVLKLVRS